jgi:outer membrane immunogenic protein
MKMRKICKVAGPLVALAAAVVPAMAADLALKAPPPPPPPPFSWTGFYIGANLGGGWENFHITDTITGATFSTSTRSAFIGGGQAGFNYQVGPYVVLGVEGFIDGIASSNNNTGAGVIVPGIGLVTASLQPDWIATFAGRIGFTSPTFDHALFYFKGGGAWEEASATLTGPGATFTSSRTGSGWMLGGGIEWAFAQNWTLKLDYQFIELDNNTLTNGFVVPDTFTTHHADISTLTVGVNYLFNWSAPAPAPVY